MIRRPHPAAPGSDCHPQAAVSPQHSSSCAASFTADHRARFIRMDSVSAISSPGHAYVQPFPPLPCITDTGLEDTWGNYGADHHPPAHDVGTGTSTCISTLGGNMPAGRNSSSTARSQWAKYKKSSNCCAIATHGPHDQSMECRGRFRLGCTDMTIHYHAAGSRIALSAFLVVPDTTQPIREATRANGTAKRTSGRSRCQNAKLP